MTVRIHFERTGRLRFTSHLDVLRTFQRAFARVGVPLAYSQGFNPHPEFVIGMPLGVGTTSSAEYADLGLANEIVADEFIRSMNASLPEGLKVCSVALRNNRDNIMASIVELRCEIEFENFCDEEILNKALAALLERSELPIEKQTKKGKKIVDIRSKIRAAKVACGNKVLLECDAGSRSNLSPDLFVEALEKEHSGGSFGYYSVHRTAVLVEKDGVRLDPMSCEALN